MSRPYSLQRRLIVVLTAAVVGFWLLAVLIAWASIDHELNEVFDSALQETAQRVLPLAVDDLYSRADKQRPRRLARAVVAPHQEHLTYQLRDRSGRVLLRSHDAPLPPFPAALRAGFSTDRNWRYYTEVSLSHSVYLQVREPLEHRAETILESLATLLGPLLALIPLSAFGIWLIVRRLLRPLQRVHDEIRERDGQQLSPLRHESLPSELVPVVSALNRLFERIGQTIAAEREFAANSSHELRTPIAAAQAQLQRLVATTQDSEVQRRAAEIEQTLKRLARLAEKLLQLAKAEAAGLDESRHADVGMLIGLLLPELDLQSAASEAPAIKCGDLTGLTWPLDVDAATIVLRNLLENARRHGVPGRPIAVSVDSRGALHIANECEPLPRDELAALTRRFTRRNRAAPGSGLGLAIVSTLLANTGGRLMLHSPIPGRTTGFEAQVSFDTGLGRTHSD